MLAIPQNIATKYEKLLIQQDVPVRQRSYYFKWLRYYLDFCNKYHLEPFKKHNFLTFDEKLRVKNQSDAHRQQAKRAVAIYYKDIVGLPIADQKIQSETIKKVNLQKEIIHLNDSREMKPSRLPAKVTPKISPTLDSFNKQQAVENAPEINSSGSHRENLANGSPDSNLPKLTGADWVWVYDSLTAAIKVRHYSPKTLQAYKIWTQKLQPFTKSKDAKLLTMDDVKNFLSFLAVEKKVASSTQN